MCPSGRYAPAAVVADVRPAFDALDADRDGKISREDLKAFCSSEDEISSMMAAADFDRNGYVEFKEFERVLAGRRTEGGEDLMEEVFKAMDRNGDGKVGFEDLKEYLSSAGLPAGDEEVRAMLRMGGGDGKDGVCFEGLVRILAFGLGASL